MDHRRWAAPAVLLGMALIGCSASAPPTGSIGSGAAAAAASATLAPSALQPATARPLPSGVTSSVVTTRKAPSGSIRNEMYNLAYHPGAVTVTGGDFTFFLVNPADKSSAEHSMAIGPAIGYPIVSSGIVPLGGSVAFTVGGLPPGHYTLWCTVDGHAQEGMVGTLTVR